MVACCRSHADRSNVRGVLGVASRSNTWTGSRLCFPRNTETCRVRALMALVGKCRPPGTAARTASHSCAVRLAGSAGQVAITAAVRPVRQPAERRIRPACSCAIRTIRSLTRIPSGGPAFQPRRRNAIHACDGNFLPPSSVPEMSASISGAVQCAASSSETMPDARSAHQPTRSVSAALVSRSPVASSTPVRSKAWAAAVRAISPSVSGTRRPTPHLPSPDLSSDQRPGSPKVARSIRERASNAAAP